MSQLDQINYHCRRANEEEERSRSADGTVASRAHERLADLHRQRIEALGGNCASPISA